MSRLENHLIQIKYSSNELKETILKTLYLLHAKVEEKNINIIVSDPEKIKLLHDPNWLGEAIYNILDNSIKYSDVGSVIEVTLSQNQMFTEISVRDYGRGIQAGEEQEVFKRFYRGEHTKTEEGFGLGLFLSREIILSHDGFIKLTSMTPGLLVSIMLDTKQGENSIKP